MILTFPKDGVGGFGHLVGYECLTSFRGWLKVVTGHGKGEVLSLQIYLRQRM